MRAKKNNNFSGKKTEFGNVKISTPVIHFEASEQKKKGVRTLVLASNTHYSWPSTGMEW